jgi:hypothetical protein
MRVRDGSSTGDIFKAHFARTVDELVALEISLRTTRTIYTTRASQFGACVLT